MDSESVMEFLGYVPLLQRLPSSSLKKLAQVVIVRHFEQGDYLVRDGNVAEGIYFIVDGEAQVRGSFHADDKDHHEFKLRQYDYFGHGLTYSMQPADVIALSKLTCLVLPKEHENLLRPKSIWSADETEGKPRVEQILHADPMDVNTFQCITLPDAPMLGRVYGGQFLGQALAAACKTVDFLKIVHSLHAYFLLIGNLDIPIIYQVYRVHDGKGFATRRVDALQNGNLLFTLMASFQKEEEGFKQQVATMPSVPHPEELISMENVLERHHGDSFLLRTLGNKVAAAPWPIEIRFCEPNTSTDQTESPSSLNYWFRARGTLSDEPALHRCVAAYASDFIFVQFFLNPHGQKRWKLSGVSAFSLSHTIWFYRPFRADDWLLFVIDRPNVYNGRGIVCGRMFNRTGELVVSLTQEGSLRYKTPVSTLQSKL